MNKLNVLAVLDSYRPLVDLAARLGGDLRAIEVHEELIAVVTELVEAVRPAITEEGMDQAELDRLREAFARVGGAS